MKNIMFACDLDNTLIYSKNRPHEGFLCVEWIHDKKQGFMSPQTIELLKQVNRQVMFVPVTTRSVEQYLRIRFPDGCSPEYAVVANGAILLKDGQPVPEWSNAFHEKNAEYFPEIERMYEQQKDSRDFIRCRKVDNAYMFVYCSSEIDPAETGKSIQNGTKLKVAVSGKKIYLFPPELHKGTAVQHLLEWFCP